MASLYASWKRLETCLVILAPQSMLALTEMETEPPERHLLELHKHSAETLAAKELTKTALEAIQLLNRIIDQYNTFR